MPCCSSSTPETKAKKTCSNVPQRPVTLSPIRPSDKVSQCCASNSKERCKCGSSCACNGCNTTKL
ncbi:uncharacterized protein LALA0_S04e03114g [Lachancea lanzarotensis]|uniref:LALA0S04e03114g1_1 n=1 Tax=Lachancea lanzarotensis TaxID=1245769 RepID=A0A0C7MWC4_9SACH|nr:uncharacterized protein LALA0_S04e03114g [Lachancea lanzarotensis]CEP61895.1 LALA0S04e03114g1_1 [Lachancea lanzarotensis]